MFETYAKMSKKYRHTVADGRKYVVDDTLLKCSPSDDPLIEEIRENGVADLLMDDALGKHSHDLKLRCLQTYVPVEAVTDEFVYYADLQFEITAVYGLKDGQRKYLYYKLIGARGYRRPRVYFDNTCEPFNVGEIPIGTPDIIDAYIA